MTISTRTPEGLPHRCPVCHAVATLEPCYPGGDAVCPACGSLLWQFRDQLNRRTGIPPERITFDTLLSDELGMDSLELVEMVMEIEEQSVDFLPEGDPETFRSIRDIIAHLRRREEQ